MNIEINNTTKTKINTKLLKHAVDIFGKKFKRNNSSVSVAIVGEAAIKKLNAQYRHKNKVTDVLSFVEADRNNLGEVILCYSQITRQAKKLGHSIDEELVFIFVHGLLHLIGYDDKTTLGWQEMEKIGLELCKTIMAEVI